MKLAVSTTYRNGPFPTDADINEAFNRIVRMRLFITVLLSLMALPVQGQVSVSFTVSESAGSSSFQMFVDQVLAADSADRDAIVDSFMNATTFPFVEGDTAVFIHRGAFSSVNVPGDANGWDPNGFPMQRLADTDLWYHKRGFETTARLDYKFVTSGTNWILDPRNPNTVEGGFGPNSELAMPEYVQPEEIVYRADVPHGTLVDSVFTSTALGTSREVQIYLPAGYDSSSSYGMILFHDGPDYLNLASVTNVLDNLIGDGLIAPIVAVFIPPVDRNNEYAFDKTHLYESFIVNELMPWIMDDFAVSDDPLQRGTTGVSFGGLISTQLCYRNPEMFGLCGPVSPSYWAKNNEVMNEVLNGDKKDIRFYLDWGTYEPGIASTGHTMRDGLQAKGYDLTWNEWHEGHSWGNWRAHIDNMLEYFFPPAGNTGIVDDDFLQDDELSVFPNPVSDRAQVEVRLSTGTPAVLEIHDISGRRVREGASAILHTGTNVMELPVHSLAAGVYIISLTLGTAVRHTTKIVKL